VMTHGRKFLPAWRARFWPRKKRPRLMRRPRDDATFVRDMGAGKTFL
jgi:hypothetical protein